MNILKAINNKKFYYLLKKYKIYTIKDIIINKKFNNKINKNSIRYSEIIDLINSLKSDNISEIIKYSNYLYNNIKYDIFCVSYYKTEENINNIIYNMYGLFIPNIIHYYLLDMLRDNYIYKLNNNEQKTIYISNLNGLINLYPLSDTKKGYSGLDLFKLRLKGEKYKNLSKLTNYSKQVLSIKLSKFIRNMPKIYENKYFNIFFKYKMNINDFKSILNIQDERIYYYLKIVGYNYKLMNNKKSINTIIKENSKDNISKEIKDNIKLKLSNNKFIIYNNEKIYLKNDFILNYIFLLLFKINKKEIVKIKEIIGEYKNIIKNIPQSYNFKAYSDRSLKNKLKNSYKLILSLNEEVRLYNIKSIDINEFIVKYNLYQYQNVIISTQLLINKYPNILYDLKLRNCYELHNLLKKNYKYINATNSNTLKLTFNRMPHLKFGKINIKKQISDFIKNNSMQLKEPAEIAKEINKEYGLKTNTVLANYIKSTTPTC